MKEYRFNNEDWRVWDILEANPFGLTKEEIAQKMGMVLETVEKSLKLLTEMGWVRESDGKFTLAY
jgi:DNA-binding IclR family transcriptional regulator